MLGFLRSKLKQFELCVSVYKFLYCEWCKCSLVARYLGKLPRLHCRSWCPILICCSLCPIYLGCPFTHSFNCDLYPIHVFTLAIAPETSRMRCCHLSPPRVLPPEKNESQWAIKKKKSPKNFTIIFYLLESEKNHTYEVDSEVLCLFLLLITILITTIQQFFILFYLCYYK